MKQILDLTKILIMQESDNQNFVARNKCLKIIKNFVMSNTKGVQFTIHRNKSPMSNQIIESLHIWNHKQEQKKSILLLGHVDVVSASKLQFKPVIKNGFLFGRGSGDMKSAVAIAVMLFVKHHKTKNIQLAITNDEEIGGEAGAGQLAKKLSPTFLISIEPTNLEIRVKEKGAMQVEIEVEGPGGHGSRPWTNLNSIDILIEVYEQLKKIFPNPKKEIWKNTLNIGGIIGGNIDQGNLGSANIIASNASMKLDIRLIDTRSHEKGISLIKQEVKKIEKKLPKKRYKILVKKPSPIVEHLNTRRDNPFVKRTIIAFKKALHTSPRITNGSAASDARFFSSKGIPSIVFGPVSINHHATNEKVEISSLKKTYDVLDNLLSTY